MPVVGAIRSWLEAAFPESNVRLEEDQARDLSRFLIEDRASGKARVFEVLAIRLHTDPTTVVRYLTDQGVATRLREAPTWRARFGPGDALEYFQQLHLRCDGKSYFILQNAQRQVTLMDAQHRPLAKAPAVPAPPEGDITAVAASVWHQRIRSWRGADQ